LVGAGTGHPHLRDQLTGAVVDGGPQPVATADEVPQAPNDPAGRYPTVAATSGEAVLTWSLRQPAPISQISLGAVTAVTAATAATAVTAASVGGTAGTSGASVTSVQVALRGADGSWSVVAAASGPVGSGASTPFLLIHLPPVEGRVVTAIRVTVGVDGSATIGVHDFHALGQSI
jgi:hypothetical protein